MSGFFWLPIIAHFVNNASAVILMYLFNEELVGVDPDKLGTEGQMTLVMISVITTGGLLWMVHWNAKAKNYSAGNA